MSWWHRLRQGQWRLQAASAWSDAFDMAQPDKIMNWKVTNRFHAKQGRSTGRVVLDDGRLVVYLKRHWQLPWYHGLLAMLWPGGDWSPAASEWKHLHWAMDQGLRVPEPLAVGECIGPGISLKSFLVIRELHDMLPLHEAIPHAQSVMSRTFFTRWKQKLFEEVAAISRKLHDQQHYHKDLYLCHFYVREPQSLDMEPGPMTLIDLHRLGHHPWLSLRWQIKDLAQLYFSTMGVTGIEEADRLTLFHHYFGTEQLTGWQQWIYQAVVKKAQRYARHNQAVESPARRQPGKAA